MKTLTSATSQIVPSNSFKSVCWSRPKAWQELILQPLNYCDWVQCLGTVSGAFQFTYADDALYTARGKTDCRPGFGAKANLRFLWTPSLTDTHRCPQVHYDTLWIPSKVRHQAYPATSPCVLLSPLASSRHTCALAHTHINGSPSQPWDRMASPGFSLDLMVSPVPSSLSGLTRRHAHIPRPGLWPLDSQLPGYFYPLASPAWYLLSVTHRCMNPCSLGLLTPQTHWPL